MRRYVTLFDSSYAIKGTLMLRSLERASRGPYEVTVIALDDRVAAMRWPGAVVVQYASLEAAIPELLAVRLTRTHREWCWTLASAALLCRLRQAAPGELVTYLDADLAFYSDPEACFVEIGDRSIGIVPHRFPEHYRHCAASAGVFNVSWVSLRNDQFGRGCVEGWVRRVLARCSEADCGDQRYLDAWPERYGDRLCAFDSPGIGVAPWNVWAYDVRIGADGPSVDGHPVVFYHYHELAQPDGDALLEKGITRRGNVLYLDGFRLTLGYPLRAVDIDAFYRGYCREYGAVRS